MPFLLIVGTFPLLISFLLIPSHREIWLVTYVGDELLNRFLENHVNSMPNLSCAVFLALLAPFK